MNVSIFLLVALHLISGLTLISEAASITNYDRNKYPPLCLFKLCNLAPRKSDFDFVLGGTDYDDSKAIFDDYNFGRPIRNFVINIVYFVVNQNKVQSDNKVIKSDDDEVTESTVIAESTSVTEEKPAIEIKKDNEHTQIEGSSRPKRDICYFKICSMRPPRKLYRYLKINITTRMPHVPVTTSDSTTANSLYSV